MLSLVNITKEYYIGKKKSKSFQVVEALKGVTINFRKHEFVSILGQSGCGKTTLLNIIGGLDHYTSGDLIINGISTTKYKDKDWDNYRNHSIGFIFQSYNLIPHQNVLVNVELALTLSGIKKEERKRRAIEVLTKVGLADKIYSMPNQLSGGQMQRVAIARALVNDPDIILADEPTGALDSATSVQIMDILKEISKDKLIIMVTHNPDLAKTYSTRIVELFDGSIVSDSMPYDGEMPSANEESKPSTKTKMSFFTALSLSIKNLFTKKARTGLVSFAGSIGIIGIALILSMQSGFQSYMGKMQEETLSSYPITLDSQTSDMSALLEMFMEQSRYERDHELDAVYSRSVLAKLWEAMQKSIRDNNLKDFKYFLENDDKAKELIVDGNISYEYQLKLQIYSPSNYTKTLPTNLMQLMGDMMSTNSNAMEMYSTSSNTDIWAQMVDNFELIGRQYDVVKGRLPSNYNEVIVILDENNEINDYVLYALDFISLGDLATNKQVKISYDKILSSHYMVLPNTSYYELDENNIAESINKEQLRTKLESDEAIKLDIVGIVRPKSETVGQVLSGAIGYSSNLVKEVIRRINNSDVAKWQIQNPNIDVFTGKEFDSELIEYTSADVVRYLSTLINSGQIEYGQYIYDGLEKSYFLSEINTSENKVKSYLSTLLATENASDIDEFYSETYTKLTEDQKYALLKDVVDADISSVIVASFKEVLDEYNESANLESNMKKLGICDLDNPSRINIYAYNFENKENIVKLIDEYNVMVTERDGNDSNVINFTDYIGLVMDSVSTMIDIISTVLIAFVSVSLVVSSIMIGVITYISVLERIKEIGILRAIGASKKDIKRVFTAESVTIGFLAGLMGIIITFLFTIPVNILLKAVVDISNLAKLPIFGSIVLIGVSVFMTFIAGLFPARLASKKDPVIALRTE